MHVFIYIYVYRLHFGVSVDIFFATEVHICFEFETRHVGITHGRVLAAFNPFTAMMSLESDREKCEI